MYKDIKRKRFTAKTNSYDDNEDLSNKASSSKNDEEPALLNKALSKENVEDECKYYLSTVYSFIYK